MSDLAIIREFLRETGYSVSELADLVRERGEMGTNSDAKIYFARLEDGMDYEKEMDEKWERIDELQDEMEDLMDEIADLSEESDLFNDAVALRRDMSVFVKAGFTEDQAFDLIKLMFLRILEDDDER